MNYLTVQLDRPSIERHIVVVSLPMATFPSAEEIITKNGGKPLILQRSLRSLVFYFLAFFAATLVVYLLNWWLADFRFSEDLPVIKHLSVRWLAIVPALILLETLRKYHDDLYVFEGHRILHKSGRLSLSYAQPMIKYSDIRGIAVHQDIYGRLLNYGRIDIGTAAHEGKELQLEGVLNPSRLETLVDELRSRSKVIEAKEIKSLKTLREARNVREDPKKKPLNPEHHP